MKEFEYPIDPGLLLQKKRKLKRLLKENLSGAVHKKIAVLGGSTTNELVDQLELFLLHYGIEAEFYQSEYGQFWQDAMFENPELQVFAPDFIYIHTSWRNILRFPDLTCSEADTEALFTAEIARFRQMWAKLEETYHCPIIQNNFDRPNYRLLGNRDIWDARGRSYFLLRLNEAFARYAQEHPQFYINDLDYLAGEFGLTAWNDAFAWNMYKYAMALRAIPSVAKSVAEIIKSVLGKNKKLLALDLDQTLWGGIVGDDGVDGIAIGPEVPSGQVYSEFQSYCKALQQIGVVLAVDSKNDESNALAGLNHPDGVLRPEDFVSIKANWNPKDQNLREIAEELSLGTDSFVFLDDNPAEREIVAVQMPGVAVPPVEHPEDYITYLDRGGYFEVTALSREDGEKTKLYHAKAEAAKQAAGFADYGAYLDSLQMEAEIQPFQPLYQQRIAQLTNKSNQFNLTTLRCTESDIAEMAAREDYMTLAGRLKDRFADHGVVTVAAGEIVGRELHIRLWLMSCRVLKRGMEDAMLDVLIAQAKERAIETVYGYYYPTPKNGMVKEFYGAMGFTRVTLGEDGSSRWRLNISDYEKKNRHIHLADGGTANDEK